VKKMKKYRPRVCRDVLERAHPKTYLAFGCPGFQNRPVKDPVSAQSGFELAASTFLKKA
jgi:hypothetical protein